MSVLEVENVSKKFGGLLAVDNCSFSVAKNSIMGLMGPNGSGKTTIFNLISGLLKPDSGMIRLNGRHIDGLKPYAIARLGVGRTFQLTRPFRGMTTLNNILAVSPTTQNFRQSTERGLKLLESVNLLGLKDELSCNLSYGQQKLLEFARLMMLDFDLMLLDEPVAGVNPVLAEKMLEHVLKLKNQGKTFVVIEHSTSVMNKICDTIIVLDHGQMIAEGTPAEIRNNEKVQKAYFLL